MDQEAISRRRGRARRRRCVRVPPDLRTFKPRGTPMTELEVQELKVEELEAVRLVDLLDMDLGSAARSMNVSRRTLTRDLKSGRRKVADMVVNGKALVIKGGDYELKTEE